MADFTCSACGKGNMELKTIPEHATALGGVPFVARDAQVYECSHCGAWTATGKELKRWRAQQQIELQAKGAVPSGADVRRVREAFGLSVSDFASLLAVTRQTVHAWERADGRGMQLGPAALLVKALESELAQQATTLYEVLTAAALSRGVSVSSSQPPGVGSATESLRARASPTSPRSRPKGSPGFATKAA